MGQIVTILQNRSPVLHFMSPDHRVADAITVMAVHQVGAVLVVDQDGLAGIFSERDVVRRVMALGRSPAATKLVDVMTPDPVVAEVGESRRSAIRKMRAVGCRHLPVVAESQVIDMISIRDLLYSELEERGFEVESLRSYISGTN
jgi:CBS domain-containing protein